MSRLMDSGPAGILTQSFQQLSHLSRVQVRIKLNLYSDIFLLLQAWIKLF